MVPFAQQPTMADGETIEVDELKGEGKVIALYVAGSGRYERTCKQFSMHLATMYAAGLKDKGLEVILVPLDDDNASFTRHFQSHPWLAIPQGDRRVAKLLQHYKVESVPHLMLFDGATGKVSHIANAVTLAAIRLGSLPADDDHPYGHGRFESVASLAIGGLLVGTVTREIDYGISSFLIILFNTLFLLFSFQNTLHTLIECLI